MSRQGSTDTPNRIVARYELSSAQSCFAFDGPVIVVGFREFGRISTAC